MIDYFVKTAIGRSHVKNDIVCQDFSEVYHDEQRTIMAVCDGHGGEIYVRSDRGSKFACDAVMNVLKEKHHLLLYRVEKADFINRIKLEIMCEWNKLVEQDLSKHPISIKEVAHLNEDKQFRLKVNPTIAYGTTLNAVMVLGNRILCVSLGDGGLFGIKRGNVTPILFEDDEETVANITYSMCQEDAFKHLNAEIYDLSDFSTIFLCTDGVVNPYQNLDNFSKSFIFPVLKLFKEGNREKIDQFITDLGLTLGIGDDVSLGILSIDK
ncbi:MAG: protein phosphatase 2C domain-containing protein [Clostridia bacterium]|nr:protein phosphatase 2C domain-containing protein [Clostridia bacterium]